MIGSVRHIVMQVSGPVEYSITIYTEIDWLKARAGLRRFKYERTIQLACVLPSNPATVQGYDFHMVVQEANINGLR